MNRILWIALVLALVLPVAAQRQPDSGSLPGAMEVTGVTLMRGADNVLSLLIQGNPASCEPVIAEQSRQDFSAQAIERDFVQQGIVVDVQLTSAPAADGAVCNFFAPFETTVELEGAFETDREYILIVNDFAAWIFLVRPGGIVLDLPFQAVDVGDTELLRWQKVPASIDDVSWAVSDEEYVINISGTHPDGCQVDTISRLVLDSLDPTLYYVDAFRLLPADVRCPAVLAEFAASVDSGLSINRAVTIQVGSQWYRNEPDGPQPVMPRPIEVVAVAISGTAGAYAVNVTGAINGNCGEPLQELVGDVGAFSIIEIFDLVPEVAPCTMDIIPYDNTFTVARLPVIVNGQIYFADGAVPGAPVDSDTPMPGDANVIQVDTVIETVEVLVLESFPMQLNLMVTGYQPDGCQFPVQVTQERVEDTVTVHIFRTVPADVMCPAVITPYEDSVAIEGGFTGGIITIHVNDQTVTVEL